MTDITTQPAPREITAEETEQFGTDLASYMDSFRALFSQTESEGQAIALAQAAGFIAAEIAAALTIAAGAGPQRIDDMIDSLAADMKKAGLRVFADYIAFAAEPTAEEKAAACG